MAKTEGFNVKVKINGTAFRARRVEADDTCADLEVGDSEDGVFEAHIGGRAAARITIENATWNPADNPHKAPYLVEARAHVAIQIYWAGLGEDFDNYPDVLVTSAKKAADVTALIPFSMTGVSNGLYTPAGS